MEKLTIEEIKGLQKAYGMHKMQELIDSGEVWKFEGSMGRSAMDMLESGACFLPEEDTRDYYGNLIPSRNRLEDGTKGTLGNSQEFWQKVEEGEIILETDEVEEEVS